jgi:hypothetical protein
MRKQLFDWIVCAAVIWSYLALIAWMELPAVR